MKRTSMYAFVVALVAAMAIAPYVEAAGLRSPMGNSIRSAGRGMSRSSGRGSLSGLSRGIGRSGGLSGLSRNSGSSRNPFNLPNLSGDSRSSRNPFGMSSSSNWGRYGSGSPFGRSSGLFGNMGGPGYYNNRYDSHYRYEQDRMAKAYRDVGMAQALVGLVGIVATVAQQPPQYAAVPAQGYWQRQAVIVQPQRYEHRQEYIPPLYDSRTGQKIGGDYHESRTVLVPEVVEYRDVWVTQ